MTKLFFFILFGSYWDVFFSSESNQRAYHPPHPSEEHCKHTHVPKENTRGLSSRPDLFKMNSQCQSNIHELVFVVKQKNVNLLSGILHDLSDPSSSLYGQHWSREKVADFTSNPEASNAVKSYLNLYDASISSTTKYGEFITASAPISVWEKMFSTKFYVFHQIQRDESVEKFLRTEKYWIPQEIDIHIESVFNTIDMPMTSNNMVPKQFPKINSDIANEHYGEQTNHNIITPSKLRDYYNVSNYASGSVHSTQGIVTNADVFDSGEDLSLYENCFDLFNRTDPVTNSSNLRNDESVDFGRRNDTMVSNIYSQYMVAISPLSPTTCWQTDRSFSSWLPSLADVINPPLVLVISFSFLEDHTHESLMDAFNIEAIKLGIMGVTLIIPAGDDGANSLSCGHKPLFPASSPYVTTVGATAVRYIKLPCLQFLVFVMHYLKIPLFSLSVYENMSSNIEAVSGND